jgi:hypothetical protein
VEKIEPMLLELATFAVLGVAAMSLCGRIPTVEIVGAQDPTVNNKSATTIVQM